MPDFLDAHIVLLPIHNLLDRSDAQLDSIQMYSLLKV